MKSKSTIIAERAKNAYKILESCSLCGHRCEVNRIKGDKGKCSAGEDIFISSYTTHHGEEPVFSGARGSGTIFFSNCNLRCVFCQNYEISQKGLGYKVSPDELSSIMLDLQKRKCHNINLVSPTHYMPQILKALEIALGKGLNIPIVYNTNGYDSLELLKLLDGVIDVYMPDFKYYDSEKAKRYSNAKRYVETAKEAMAEMFEQVGNLELDEDGVAQKGLLVRHLVLPNNISGSKKVLEFLSSVSKELRISLMSQYSPQYRACEYVEMNRKIKMEEYYSLVEYAESLGFENLLIQEASSADIYLPDFKKKEPFSF